MKKCLTIFLGLILSPVVYADEVHCLAKNIFWEARNQSVSGMVAVADVTLNRVKDPRWPDTVCGVVEQRKRVDERLICQFSWFCDGLSDRPKDNYSYSLCYMIAYIRLQDREISVLPNHVYWYHNASVSPYWASAYSPYVTIGDHTFYSDIQY